MHEWFDVCGTARQRQLRPSEIWRRPRAGQMARIGHYVQRDGFAAILVDLAGLTDGADEVSVDIVARSKGLKPADLGRLFWQGHAPSPTRQGPRSGEVQVVLSEEDLVALNLRSISLRELGLAADPCGADGAVIAQHDSGEDGLPDVARTAGGLFDGEGGLQV